MDDVKFVSAALDYTMAIKTDGSLYGWGSNAANQLGTLIGNADEPTFIMENIVYVSAGDHHTLAINTNGAAEVWGANAFGQLGLGTNQANKGLVPFLSPAMSVSARGLHSIVLLENGRVYAMGLNMEGQLGNGTQTDSHSPVPVIFDAMVHGEFIIPTPLPGFEPPEYTSDSLHEILSQGLIVFGFDMVANLPLEVFRTASPDGDSASYSNRNWSNIVVRRGELFHTAGEQDIMLFSVEIEVVYERPMSDPVRTTTVIANNPSKSIIMVGTEVGYTPELAQYLSELMIQEFR
jgi:hypothetical protein